MNEQTFKRAISLLARAVDRLQSYSTELDENRNDALATEIEKFLKELIIVRAKPVWYVGYCFDKGTKKVFKWTLKREPEPQDNNGEYFAVWGPFKTLRGAMFAASPATIGNPHTVLSSDCDRIAKESK